MGVLDEAEYLQLTALGIAAAVNAGALSAVEVLDAAWGRLERVEPRLRAFTHLWADHRGCVPSPTSGPIKPGPVPLGSIGRGPR